MFLWLVSPSEEVSTGTENTWIQRLIDVDFSPYILCELGELLCWFDRCSDTQIVHSKHNKRIWFFSTASLSEVYLVLGSFWDLYIPVSCITELSASTCLCVCCVYAGGYWAAPPQKIRKKKKSTREGGEKNACHFAANKPEITWQRWLTHTYTHCGISMQCSWVF